MPWPPTHRACGPSPRRHARVRPGAVASPNRGLGLASRHPEEIVAGPFLALCAPSDRRGLAEPVEELHDQGELLLEVRIELVGFSHGEEPLRQTPHGVAQRSLDPRRRPHRYLGAGKLRHDVVLPAHDALAALFSRGQLATG